MNPQFIDLMGSLAAVLLICLTLPGTVELLLLTVGSVLPDRRWPGEVCVRFSTVVVVPAHNEAEMIGECVASLLACDWAGNAPTVVVVADNCTDDTAKKARQAGARVLIRDDPGARGKGYALDFAFRRLLRKNYQVYVVVDADTVVDPNLIVEIHRTFTKGADAVQVRYAVRNPSDSVRTRLMNVALYAFNTLRPRGRDRLGLSVGILGNGFALSRETILAVSYHARSIVEDLEYHLTLVRSGRKVRFTDATSVYGRMPVSGKAARTQRARWEGGRTRMLVDHGPSLLRGIMRGEIRLVEPLMDLLLLPLSFHVLLLLLTLFVLGDPVRTYALAGLGVVGLHVLCSILVAGDVLRDLTALLAAPLYVIWKILILPLSVRAAGNKMVWVRTNRENSKGG